MSRDQMPPYSCPHFDSAIVELESARSANEEMRGIADAAFDDLEDVQQSLEESVASLVEANEFLGEREETIENLEARVAELEKELAELQVEFDDAMAVPA